MTEGKKCAIRYRPLRVVSCALLSLSLYLTGCRGSDPRRTATAQEIGPSGQNHPTANFAPTAFAATAKTKPRFYGLAEQDKDWQSDRATMDKILDDVAFTRQKPVLESFYADVVDLHEKNHSYLIFAPNTTPSVNQLLANPHWFGTVNAKTNLDGVLTFIERLPSRSRDDALASINSFRPFTKNYDTILLRILNAYTNATAEVHDRFKVDLSRYADMNERMRNLTQVVDNYISADDFISAYVVIQHADVFYEDLLEPLLPFDEDYRKSHPHKD